MLVFSFEKKRGIKLAALLGLSAVLLTACAVIAFQVRDTAPEYATADEVGKYSTAAADTKGQIKFLRQFNLIADIKTKKSDEITIPNSFNEIYRDYNELQKAIGLNLEPFGGKQAEKVVYRLRNDYKYVTLLIYKNRVIGGHISTGEYGDGYEALNGTTG